MKNLPRPKQASLALLRQAAINARARYDFVAYFDLMRQATLLSPNDPDLLLDLGLTYGIQIQFPEAVECFERAVAGSRDKSRILAMAAIHCRKLSRFDLAADYLERAVREPGVSPDTFAELAEIKERQREAAGAEAAVENALRIDPKCQSALVVRARLNRLAGHMDEAEKIVRSILSRTDRSGWNARIRGWYELAAILDRLGRYDEAFDALMTAKQMVAPRETATISKRKAFHERLLQRASELSSSHLQRWRAADPEPNARRLAVIAGNPRSGTTLLEQILDAHSAILSAEETAIFAGTYGSLARASSMPMVTMLDSLSDKAVREAREDYFRRMDLFLSVPTHDRVLIDKNPSFTDLIPALLRIIPQAQIIVALRDPRDVCLSCFMQDLPQTPISAMYLTMEGTVDEYCSQMGFWQAIKPLLKTSAMEVRYEDVVSDIQSEAEKTLRFLNLAWEPAVLNFHELARNKLVRSPTYADVARPVSKRAIGRWKHYRKYLDPYLPKLAPLVKKFGYDAD